MKIKYEKSTIKTLDFNCSPTNSKTDNIEELDYLEIQDTHIPEFGFSSDTENKLYDPSLNERFITNTCNRESYNNMIYFDEIEVSEKIYNKISNILGEDVRTDWQDIINMRDELNTMFSKIINNIKEFSQYNISSNTIIKIFNNFCDYINCDLSVVYMNLSSPYQYFIREQLMNSVGVDKFKYYEQKHIDNNEKMKDSIYNHTDVTIKKIF